MTAARRARLLLSILVACSSSTHSGPDASAGTGGASGSGGSATAGTGGTGNIGGGGTGGAGGQCTPATLGCPSQYEQIIGSECLGWICTARCGTARLWTCHGGAYLKSCVYDEQNNLIAARRWDDTQGQPYYCTVCPGSCSSGGEPTIGPFPAAGACVFDTPEAGTCP